MELGLLRKINLIEALSEDFPDVPEPPEEAAESWTENQIRAYFDSQGAEIPNGYASAEAPAAEDLHAKFPPADPELFRKWFPGLKLSRTSTDSPRGVVLCFHNAGNEENMYTSEGLGARKAPSPLLEWCRNEGWKMLSVQLPGRGMRLKEGYCKSAKDVAVQLLPVVASRIISVPYVVVAHSMGTLNAFEFLMLARMEGLPMPAAAFLSAFPAPDIPMEQRPWRQQRSLSEEQFKDECRAWDINNIIFEPAMWAMYQPMLRADFSLFDSYEFTHQGMARFEFPIHAFCGTDDRRITLSMVCQWEKITDGDVKVTNIHGNHLWPLDKEPKRVWLQHVATSLKAMEWSS